MNMKKLILLLLLFFIGTLGFSLKGKAEESSFTLQYNAINQVRGTNQIIIYTYDARTPDNKTGANQWGYEISVDENGIIVEMGVNVTFASNGFIISVHGADNVSLVQDNISLGDEATYDTNTKTITITFSILGSISNLEAQIDELKGKKIELDLGAYDIDIDGLSQAISEIEQKYNELNTLSDEIRDMQDGEEKTTKTALTEEKYNTLLEKIEQANLMTIKSLKIEARGLWHRPNINDSEITIEGLTDVIEEIKSAGFNQIYVETLWWGHTIGTSEYMDYHPRVKEGDYGEYQDYLEAFIDIAHQNNIEVHAWTETFFHANGIQAGRYPQWLTDHPEWLNLTYNGGFIQTGKGTEENFIFIDPANPEVRDFIRNYYKELITNYDLDGLQFDYIRYPDERSLEHSSGYTEVAMSAFKEENDIDANSDLKQLLLEEKNAGNQDLFMKWKEFRAKQVTTFVEDTVEEMREIDPDINISIAVGPDYTSAKMHLMQDWKTWVENGWIDIIAPMAYTHDVEWVKQVVTSMNEMSNGLTYNYTGIGAFMEGPALSYSDQILASRKLDGLGSVIFASQNILGQEEMKNVLKNGLNKRDAITPNSDIETLLDTVFHYILDKSDRIYIPKELMTQQQKTNLEQQFNTIKEMSNYNAEDYYKIQQAITTLAFDMNDYVDSVGAQRVKEDLFALIDIIDIKISRYLINYGYWNPATTEERPDTDSFTYPVVEKEKNEEEAQDNNNTMIYIIGGVLLVGVVATTTIVVLRKRR